MPLSARADRPPDPRGGPVSCLTSSDQYWRPSSRGDANDVAVFDQYCRASPGGDAAGECMCIPPVPVLDSAFMSPGTPPGGHVGRGREQGGGREGDGGGGGWKEGGNGGEGEEALSSRRMEELVERQSERDGAGWDDSFSADAFLGGGSVSGTSASTIAAAEVQRLDAMSAQALLGGAGDAMMTAHALLGGGTLAASEGVTAGAVAQLELTTSQRGDLTTSELTTSQRDDLTTSELTTSQRGDLTSSFADLTTSEGNSTREGDLLAKTASYVPLVRPASSSQVVGLKSASVLLGRGDVTASDVSISSSASCGRASLAASETNALHSIDAASAIFGRVDFTGMDSSRSILLGHTALTGSEANSSYAAGRLTSESESEAGSCSGSSECVIDVGTRPQRVLEAQHKMLQEKRRMGGIAGLEAEDGAGEEGGGNELGLELTHRMLFEQRRLRQLSLLKQYTHSGSGSARRHDGSASARREEVVKPPPLRVTRETQTDAEAAPPQPAMRDGKGRTTMPPNKVGGIVGLSDVESRVRLPEGVAWMPKALVERVAEAYLEQYEAAKALVVERDKRLEEDLASVAGGVGGGVGRGRAQHALRMCEGDVVEAIMGLKRGLY